MTHYSFGSYPSWPFGGSWMATLDVEATSVTLRPRLSRRERRLDRGDVRLVVPVGLLGMPAWVGFVAPGAAHNGLRFGTLLELRLLDELTALGWPVDRRRISMDAFRDACGERFLP